MWHDHHLQIQFIHTLANTMSCQGYSVAYYSLILKTLNLHLLDFGRSLDIGHPMDLILQSHWDTSFWVLLSAVSIQPRKGNTPEIWPINFPGDSHSTDRHSGPGTNKWMMLEDWPGHQGYLEKWADYSSLVTLSKHTGNATGPYHLLRSLSPKSLHWGVPDGLLQLTLELPQQVSKLQLVGPCHVNQNTS